MGVDMRKCTKNMICGHLWNPLGYKSTCRSCYRTLNERSVSRWTSFTLFHLQCYLFPSFALCRNNMLTVLRTEGPDFLDWSIMMHGNNKKCDGYCLFKWTRIVLKHLPCRNACVGRCLLCFNTRGMTCVICYWYTVGSLIIEQFYYCMYLGYGNINLLWQTWDKILLIVSFFWLQLSHIQVLWWN